MPKVTKEVMQALIDAHVFPPRHQRGCPKNYARTFPLVYAAKGMTIDEIKSKTLERYNELPCECKK